MNETTKKKNPYCSPSVRVIMVSAQKCIAASYGIGDSNDGGSLDGPSTPSGFGVGDSNDGGAL